MTTVKLWLMGDDRLAGRKRFGKLKKLTLRASDGPGNLFCCFGTPCPETYVASKEALPDEMEEPGC